MFPAMKQTFDGHKCKDSREVGPAVTRGLIKQDKDLYQHGIDNIPTRYNRFLTYGWNYVGK